MCAFALVGGLTASAPSETLGMYPEQKRIPFPNEVLAALGFRGFRVWDLVQGFDLS